jgi:hypothetical protein
MARDAKDKRGSKKVDRPKRATAVAGDGRGPALDKKLASLAAKRVKKLERQLTEAARVERKRIRALDRAHRRRQLIEAALDELRTSSSSRAAATDEGASAAPAEPKPAAPIATAATTPAAPATKTPTTGTRAKPAPAAATRATRRATRPRPAAPKASPRRSSKPAGPESSS